ncbi:Uncharacterised protein [Sebaldella termitidis]|uniref:Uncharacterized protein n=1 Tax=Sebaldella termitidis (strain ATCC 33386 / NCTC 11300) TaxID=526218 RepID=D1ANA1_SEBTE|nr:hypothetical protein [Sebaldella termitidis]ACZ09705.1 hypothetical protein Sterm_2861 [Sebaldella termitidis ATCC 33386]SUI25036.1 Uncharacterised protein [Sebaldella termitidis]
MEYIIIFLQVLIIAWLYNLTYEIKLFKGMLEGLITQYEIRKITEPIILKVPEGKKDVKLEDVLRDASVKTGE